MKNMLEGVAAPNMICFGRQYDDQVDDGPSVIERFNDMVRRNDPYGGGTNLVLDRIAHFNHDYSAFQADTEPELDQYVQTLFLEDFDVESGDQNPYNVLNALNEDKPVLVSQPPSHIESRPGENDAFLAAFGQVFNT